MLENRSSADSHVMAYRPDVDGMRGIAVLAVIFYHLSQRFLPGGYLGVDIFFVISGYLITSIIWREISRGDFSIVRFYDRRIRRIMPALLAVVAITTVASLIFLLPIDLIGFARSLYATLGFVANIYFWRDTDYFARIAGEKPLLHIWSLGVEEQFYLLFPLLLLLLARRGKGRTSVIIAVLCGLSLAVNMVALRFGATTPAFYLLPTRAWELGAGALLALLPARWHPTPARSAACGYLGAVLVAGSILTGWQWRSIFLPDPFFAVLGAVLLIYGGMHGKNPVKSGLSWRGLVFVGLISYSLYLWHWPVLVFLRYYLVREPNVWETVAALALMGGLSVLSWRYVERPFRSRTLAIGKVRLSALAGVVVAAAAATIILAHSGFPGRLNRAAARINASVGTNYRCPVSDYLYFDQSAACSLELPSRDPNDADIVLLGNSHAQMYAPLLRNIIRGLNLKGLLVPANACPPTYGVNLDSDCVALADRNIDAVTSLKHARVVVLGTTWDSQFMGANGPESRAGSEKLLVQGLDRTIDKLNASGKKVVLIGPLATPDWDVASIVSRDLAFGHPLDRPLSMPYQDFLARYAKLMAHFENRPDLEFVRPDLVQCRSGACDYLRDGRSLFADDNHLAAAELAPFQPAIEAAVKRALAIKH